MNWIRLTIVLNLIVLIHVVKSKDIDWCNSATTSCGASHVACNNNEEFSSNCNSPIQIELTNSQKKLILDTTNELRNKIAKGEEPGFPKAIRMAKTVWNDQLESLAELNTKKCSNSHDCHNTLEFEFSGQNLGIMSTTANYTIEQVIKERINAWYNENTYAAESDIEKFSRLIGSSG